MRSWPDVTRIPEAMRDVLIGPGAPFELVREDVRGVAMTVFAQRHRSLPAALAAAAREHPDRPYLVTADRTVTFTQAAGAAVAIAGVLRDVHGVSRGDRVALAGANSAEHALTIWGVLSLGAVVVGLNGWWTGPELTAGLDLTAPRLLVADEPRLARLTQTGSALPPTLTFADLFATAIDPSAPPSAPPSASGRSPEAAPSDGDGSAAAPVASALAVLESVEVDEDDPCAILFTSGTTGRAKGALISHRGLVNFGMDATLRGAVEAVSGAASRPSGPPVAVLAGPFFHVSGLGPLLGVAPRTGLTLVLPQPGRWSPSTHLELTARHGVTQWSGVPTQLLRLLEHPELATTIDPAAIRSIGCGGAALPPDLPPLAAQRLPNALLTGGYGMTETCGLGTAISGRRLLEHPDAAGVPTPTSEVTIRDAAGTEVADGEIGEIWLRGPSTFLGYWGDPNPPVDAGGWYRTGDFGRFDGELLHVESRLRDLIVRGGENIYPTEIENRLLAHPDITDAAVVGVAHRELGQEVMAVIVTRTGTTIDPEDIRAWAGVTLAPFKIPAHVTVVDVLPRNATGKILKQALRDRFGTPPAPPSGGEPTGSAAPATAAAPTAAPAAAPAPHTDSGSRSETAAGSR